MSKTKLVDKIQNFFNQNWAIGENDYNQLLSVILPALKAGNIDAVEKHLNKNKITAFCCSTPYLADRWEIDNENLPINSIAVINLEGTIYSWETFRLQNYIIEALNNPRISGIVLWINGPGGMVTNIDVVSNLISSATKPVASFIAGNALSAHFWIATSAHRTFIASNMCNVGSVGILSEYYNNKDYFKQNGIDYRVIYASEADLKNEEWRAIEDNNDESLMKAQLDILHRFFCDTISHNLNIAYDTQLPLFRGKLFTGDVALANAYIDEKGQLEDAVRWVLATAIAKNANELLN